MIKLIAKKGSEFEQTLKDMAEQMAKNLADGKRIVKEYTGVEPKTIGYRWAWGDVATFMPYLVKFKQEDWDKIDEKVMRRDQRDENNFKPQKRYSAGKRLYEQFIENVSRKCVTAEPLKKHGIYTMFGMTSVWVQPLYNSEKDCYMLLAGDSIPHGFQGKAKSEQDREFTIEY